MHRPDYFLPDYVRDQSPEQAWNIERLRRKLIDFYHSYGYRYVDPPIIEYANALTSGASSDLRANLVTLGNDNGKQLALRIDFTPQVARMDAIHAKEDSIERYCYAGTIIMQKPRSTKGTRNPMQIGAECIGSTNPQSDNEIVQILLLSLESIAMPSLMLRLNDLRIVHRLCELAGFSSSPHSPAMPGQQPTHYLHWLERRSLHQIQPWLQTHCKNKKIVPILAQLPVLFGDATITQSTAWQKLADVDEHINTYIKRLQTLAITLKNKQPQTHIVFDLADIRGYSYHNALTFGLYSNGMLIGQGGRYDTIGNYFGRNRPAIGFSLDMELLSTQLAPQTQQYVWIPFALISQARTFINAARTQHRAIVEAQTSHQQPPSYCTHYAVIDNTQSDGIGIRILD